MPNYTGLGQMLGALSNGGATRRQAYMRTLGRGASAENELLSARRKEAGLQALAAFAQTPEGQSAIGTALRANLNPEQLTGARRDRQAMNFANQSQQAYAAKNKGLGNSYWQALHGPLQTTREAGGVTYNPYGQSNQTTRATPVGQSTIAANQARAGHYGETGEPDRTPSATALELYLGLNKYMAPQKRANTLAGLQAFAAGHPELTGDALAMAYGAQMGPDITAPPVDLSAIAHRGTDYPFGADPGDTSLPYEPQSPQEYAALPPGSYYVDPGDGQVHVKR
jgi:hypothetical protein